MHWHNIQLETYSPMTKLYHGQNVTLPKYANVIARINNLRAVFFKVDYLVGISNSKGAL